MFLAFTQRYAKALGILLAFCVVALDPAAAATCSTATTQGAAPASWQTYCWFDFSSYNDTTARSAGGQNFSFNLSDGSTLTFNLQATTTAGSAAAAIAAPSWTGAAVGNSSFLGIPGQPILYTSNSGSTVTFTFSAINIIPPPGVASVTNYAFVAADAESTDNAEYLNFTTNGSAWAILDAVPPISGAQFPVLSGVGTTTLNEAGGGQTGNMGGYIAGTNNPTTVVAQMRGQGLQGMMFAIRFASIKLNKLITGSRIDAADQFTFRITSTSSGSPLASGTTTGTGGGPFTAAVISTASGIPITLSEIMATGSSSALSQYRGSLTCTNDSAGSPTTLPVNVITSSYDFGSLAFGDVVDCTFTNIAFPHVQLSKQLGPGGRFFTTDQFTPRIMEGATVIASTTTSGTGSTINNGTISMTQLIGGNSYALDEIVAGTTELDRYTQNLSCTNGYGGSPTTLPTAPDATFTPNTGDVITCILTNSRTAATADLNIVKQSRIVSDPINSTTNAKAIPGAIIEYTISVTNTGNLPVDASSIIISDVLPSNITYDASSPVTFTNGSTASGLPAFNAATMVTFSNQLGGGAPYNYAPNTAGFDAAVRGVRISPAGTMAAATGTAKPSFSVSFQGRVE
ncbi:MAG: CshA/CshB family fibrillar adhesin-related protein [Sphingorhabdus sp.]